MPVLSVNMAQPYDKRESQVYILPTTDDMPSEMIAINKRKYVIIKMIEFFFTVLSMACYIVGVAATESTVQDMLICVTFGAFIIYPFIFLMMNFNLRQGKTLITCNSLVTMFLIIIGTLIISSWWNVELAIDEMEDDQVENHNMEIYLKEQFSANFRLGSALICFINGALYLSESIVLALETKGYV